MQSNQTSSQQKASSPHGASTANRAEPEPEGYIHIPMPCRRTTQHRSARYSSEAGLLTVAQRG